MDVQKWIGKTIDHLTLNDNKDQFEIWFSDGTVAKFCVEGGCCSNSWIEHLETPPDVNGASLLGAESSGGDEVVDLTDPGHDCLKVYSTTFHTSKGDIVCEYRNSSNGYYGGWMEEIGSE